MFKKRSICVCPNFLEATLAVILRLDRRIQNVLSDVDKNFFQPLERFLDGPVTPDHDEGGLIAIVNDFSLANSKT